MKDHLTVAGLSKSLAQRNKPADGRNATKGMRQKGKTSPQ